MQVRVVPHDPNWRQLFNIEAARIVRALGEPVVKVHHIGSTAIPGIVAKPVIDILLEVEHIERLDQQAAAMQGLGYEVLGEFGIPGRRYFRQDDRNGTRTHQVHGCLAGSDDAVRHIAFRAYMVTHPAEAQAYGALKERLASLHPDDIAAYMDGKDSFIKDRERLALAWWASQKA
jgi:GrpB-like predicted nucleotidyltransferase (UPF0157 family)